jgi:molybdenum cofactor biosynthesis enzyme MoaA
MSLKDYLCAAPFTGLEIQNPRKILCCASWLELWLPSNMSAKDAWESDEAKKIRESTLNGSFKYCKKDLCPHLSSLINNGIPSGPIYHKSEIPDYVRTLVDDFLNNKKISPTTLQFSFDSTCNLKCPSCRNELIVEDKVGINRVKIQIERLKKDFGNTTRQLYITGTGDPFVSVGFREFLRNFNKSDWPLLDRIHLHTNATRWDKKMWESMKNVHEYIKTCEISIDAASKDTYENKVRLGGDWESLIENLKFISTIPTLKSVKTSFIVQQENYKEMKQFYDLMYSIFGNKVNVFFGKIINWGNLTSDQFLKKQVWNPTHPEHEKFLIEINRTIPSKHTFHNMHEFIKPYKSMI